MPEITTYEKISAETAKTEILDDEIYVFPVSFAQKRMWFLDQFEPGSPYYNIPTAFRLKGKFDTALFKETIQIIVQRHESIRTTFTTHDGNPVQVVPPVLDLNIPVIDISFLEPENRESEVKRHTKREARTPFDLKTGPLLRVTLLKVDERDYVILLTMHHIISDGWSMGVLVGEITAIYAALTKGQPNPLPDLPIQYADYSEWQIEYLEGQLSEKQLQYWKQKLGDNPPVLELPTDNPRPSVWTNEGAVCSRIIPKQTADRLKQFNREEGLTLFMSLISVFYVLLHRYTGQDDITIGTPIANRTRKEIESLIGIFINTLVLRLNCSGNLSFRDLAKQVKQITLEAYENQDLPFEMLVEELQPDRDMSYPPLFQVMFIQQNAPVSGTPLPNIDLSMLDVDMGTSTFDLTLTASDNIKGIDISAEYNTDLFQKFTIENLLQHFQTLLEQAIQSPDVPIQTLPILFEKEKQHILLDLNNIKKTIPNDKCVHHLFEKHAEIAPDSIAVVCNDEFISYQELNHKANQLANYLIQKGVGPDYPIGVCLDKSVDLMVAVLGILKSGGAYLPIDPSYPQDRIAYMIEDSKISILLTHKKNEDMLPLFEGLVIYLDVNWNIINRHLSNNLEIDVDQENAAYIIYTSGSTGKSKGTIVRHRGLINAYYAWEEAFELNTLCKNHLQMASFSFDVFSGDWVRALCSGGKLVMVPRELLLQAEELYQLMLKEKINIAEFVPAVLRNLVQYLEESGNNLEFFRVLIAGSDIWYVNEYQKFRRFCGENTRLINSFGLTEATIDSSFFEADTLDLADERLVPIGRPFSNMPLYILDRTFQPVPFGVRGELFVGGEGLARGYLRRPDLTAEKFVPNPFSAQAGDRLYRTGDLARFLPDGNIEFIGRIDHQVKIRGFRIELGEIETVLSQHSKINDAVVIAREDTPGDKRLVAYFTSHTDEEIKQSELREFIAQKLPEYMTPTAFILLKKIPLTPNGKVDRRSLPIPNQEQILSGIEEEFVAPRTPTEEKICDIWKDILNLEKVGVFHNFFILGGHSLLATQVISRIKDSFQIDVPLRSIFEQPTINGLAKIIESLQLAENSLDAPPIKPISRDQELPLSFAQQRLWFLDQLEPNSPFYNIPETYRIHGELNIKILERSLQELVRRHENLRTSFHNKNGKPFIKIHDDLDLKIRFNDISILPAETKEKEVQQLAEIEAQKSFQLSEPPLFNILLLKLDSRQHVILFTIHHIISDNWSTGIFVQELGIFYNALLQRQPFPLPDLEIQYADFAYWQRNWLQGEILEEHINYWKHQLKNVPPLLDLPTDKPRPATQTYNGDFQTFEFSKELSERINNICRQEGATLFMTLLAGFQVLLYRYSGQNDFCIGTPIANRNKAEIENLIGFFVNTLVIRSDLSGEPTFQEVLNRVKQTSLEAYAHQEFPFENLVELVQPDRNLSHSPLFQVMFSLQNDPNLGGNISSDLSIEPISVHSGTAKFDLTLFMVGNNNKIGGAIEFNTDLFESETIARMIQHFQLLMEKFVYAPEIPISTISLLSQEEQKAAINTSNQTENIQQIDGFVHQVFEKQVNQTPDATAVIFQQQHMSFSELNKRANQLAHVLQNLGVGPDVLVGICLGRSLELIIGLLGILKAGGAYLPLDPNYPEERLKFMLEDSGTNILITAETFLDQFPVEKIQVVCLALDWQKNWTEPEHDLNISIDEQYLAYVIYTSGSTGKPKGTLINHGGLRNYLSWCLHAYPGNEQYGSIVHSTVSFDATVTSVFPALLAGKSIVLLPETVDLEALSQTLEKYQNFCLLKITPAHLELLSHQLSANTANQLAKALVIGGENLTADQITFWQKYAPDTLLFNEYGPTETVVGCVVYEASKWRGTGSVPIGKVIPNATIYILDNHLQPVPANIPGELYIGGIGVARGYLNKPDLTAERFIPNLFASEPSTRLYKTGDLVRIQKNGNLEFLRRIDDQVKIRGYRIELGEIEFVMEQFPEILNAVVVVREDRQYNQQLIAYCVKEKNIEIELSELRTFLRKQLPDYLIPAAFVFLSELPLTLNGKVDRKALPEPEFDSSQLGYEYIEASTETEKKLTEIWKQVLGIEKIGILDNFFELGGQSLLVTQLISRVREMFDIEIPIRTLFDAPTIADFASKIDYEIQVQTIRKAPPILTVRRDQQIPLSFMQQRLWFLDQLEPGQPIYNIPNALRLKGKFDLPAFIYSCRKIIERHETLRTVFSEHEGKPFQIINNQIELPLQVVDLSDIQNEKLEKQISAIAQNDALRPFDLGKGPLIRFTFIKIANDEQVILFCLHHIISDGWSINTLMAEFSELYSSFREKRSHQLKPLPVQYADFSHWQRNWLQGDVLEQQLDYWKNKLEFSTPLLELPTDRPRPPVKTFLASHESFSLPEDLCSRLSSFGKEQKVTTFMLLLAAFQTLLHRYTSQLDICVGTPIANRNALELENLIGFFANTLVMRTEFVGNESFKDVLQKVRETSLNAYAHQDIPFEKLVDMLQLERDLSYTPIFQVMFVLQNNKIPDVQFTDLTVLPVDYKTTSTQFDLTLSMNETDRYWSGTFEYNTDLFDPETIKRMISHFQILLRNIVENPEKPISELSILTFVEEHRLLVAWNDTQKFFPHEKCIHELFEEQVRCTPDEIALEFEDQILTYQELNRRSNQLANYLVKFGAGPEVIVAVSLERSIEMIVAIVGILKSGSAYLPVDPTLPMERISYILSDTQVSIILTQNNLSNKFSNFPIEKILLDSDREKINSESFHSPVCTTCSTNLAYIIYTSGSTGQPKGVLLQHKGLVNLALAHIQEYGIYYNSRLLQFASLGFDASVSEIFSTFLAGGTLVLVRQEIVKSISDFIHFMQKKEIAVLTLPPSLLALLPPDQIPSLKSVISAGEVCSKEIAAKWSKNHHFVNGYGPTESTVGVTSFIVDNIPNNWKAIPIGKPLSNTNLFILDRNLNPVPIGVTGELCISGVGLARGYLNRSDLTASTFVPNPFGGKPGERIYRSGDLARYLPDGNIEFLGRIDSQVKLRGFRIELGEIENTLKKYPNIIDSVVLVKQDQNTGGQHLVAFIISDETNTISSQDVKGFLQEYLPDYMIPIAFIPLDKFPLTPNGKVDRKALEKHDITTGIEVAKYVAPRNPIEEILCSIFSQLLNIKKIGIHDNFFNLGGHSLLATQVNSRIRDAFNIEFPLMTLFEHPTIVELSSIVKDFVDQKQGIKTPPIVKISRDQDIPLSFSQQRLWFLNQLDPENISHNIPIALHVSGDIDIEVLIKSFKEVVRRHEILRTNFVLKEGAPVQRINPYQDFKIQTNDLTSLTIDDKKIKLINILEQETTYHFDLEKDSLLRVKLIKLSSEKLVISILMHHIITDGWSINILIREVAAHYSSLLRNVDSAFPAPELQFADFSFWQRDWLKDEVLEQQLSFWKDKLKNAAPMLELPTDKSRPTIKTFNGAREAFSLNEEITKKISEICKKFNVTPFMFLLSVFKILLYRYSGQKDILVGTPIANRNRVETEQIIGFFANTLVLRTEFSNNPSFVDFLSQIRGNTLEVFNHQDIPFEKIVETVQPERSLSYSPLFQVMFVLQNIPVQPVEMPEIQIKPIEAKSNIVQFDLTLSMEEANDIYAGWLEFNTDLFFRRTIIAMIQHFKILFEAILNEPEKRLSEFDILNKSDQSRQLVEWNTTSTTYPDQNTVHELFERQVLISPDSIAVEFEDEQLSYSELNSQANCLANYLRKKGVTTENIIGLSVPRSAKMIVGLLGILKAGAAYLPLDPTYPEERLSFILTDAQVDFILTEESLKERFSTKVDNLIFLDSDWSKIQDENDENLSLNCSSDNLAYMIYTSGSTGVPKGVLLQHQGLCNLAMSQINDFRVTTISRVLQFASFSFDASVSEVFMALLSGATLVLANQEKMMSISNLAELLTDRKISVVTLPPSVINVLPENDYRHLETLVSAGETCSSQIASKWSRHLRFINAYGPTEITVSATSNIVNKVSKFKKNTPIGKPISNKKIYVLDEFLNPVPVGVKGELYIGGIGVARGYINRPDLTAERFLPNPFDERSGSRFYRTGDLVKYSHDGNLEFIERRDHQVKVRGFRIELGEIEASLKRLETIQEAAVIVQEGSDSSEARLIAFISTKSEQKVSENSVKTYLKKYLPDYMIPSLIISLDKFPLTTSGKIDRSALPNPNILHAERDFVAPRDDVETRLVEIFENTLKIKPVGITDNFFNIGGHSLLAVRLLTQIQEEFKQEITLVELFEEPTVENLARLIKNERIDLADPSNVLYKFHDAKNGKTPMFFIHPSGGMVHWYFQLAKAIGKEQPFYGIRAVGIDGKKEPHTRIEQMASHYVAAILDKQPKGPYIIGSWSMGVIIAYEVAQQLVAKNLEVARLFLFDQGPHIPNEKHEDDAEFLVGMFMGRLSISVDQLRPMTYDDQLKYVLKTAKKAKQLPKIITLSQFRTYVSILKIQQDAWRLYKIKEYLGRVTLIRSQSKHKENPQFDLGWGKYALGGVEIHETPGDHNTMLHKPDVTILADKIRSLIKNSIEA